MASKGRSLYWVAFEDDDKDFKEVLGTDEEDAIYRWAKIHNLNSMGICKSQSGEWHYYGEGIKVAFAYPDTE